MFRSLKLMARKSNARNNMFDTIQQKNNNKKEVSV